MIVFTVIGVIVVFCFIVSILIITMDKISIKVFKKFNLNKLSDKDLEDLENKVQKIRLGRL